MGLNSFSFIVQMIALTVTMLLLQLLRKKSDIWKNIQIFLLFLYSYYFIGSVDFRFAVCVAFVTIIAYVSGCIIDSTTRLTSNKHFVAYVGGTALLLILVYFKYTNFFIESFNRVFGMNIGLLKLILPIGISFYSFSALSYLIDVYNCRYKAEKNLLTFGLYMAFFPKITAGPIVRWKEFREQIDEYRGVSLKELSVGIQIFVFGLFKKMVLADHLGVFVDDVFQMPTAFSTGTVILSAISYSLQIYLDFSGYSDMAIGIAKIMGFDFKANFNLPYISRDFSDFWSRWHISLSQWFRDYIYIPLGGNRKGEIKTYANLIIVMMISGLWHGAGWTFILWGMLHGIASCVSRSVKKTIIYREYEGGTALRIIEVMITFIVATLFWTIFRAENFTKVSIYLRALFSIHDGIKQPYTWSFFAMLCMIFATVMAFLKAKSDGLNVVNGYYPMLDLTKIWGLILFFTFCGLTVLLGYYGNTAFIYGGF